MTTDPAKPRHLYRDSETIYCAEDLDQCWKLFEEDTGEERAEREEWDPFVKIPDDEVLEICSDEQAGDAGEYQKVLKRRDGSGLTLWCVKKLAGEWAAECAPGHFSGGDY